MTTSKLVPNKCPDCGSPAYIGMSQVECINPGCRQYHAATALAVHKEEKAADNTPAVTPAPPDDTTDPRDWWDCVLDTPPLNPLDEDRWEYIIPDDYRMPGLVPEDNVRTDNQGRKFRGYWVSPATRRIKISRE